MYVVAVSKWFEVHGTLEDPGELLDTVKRKALLAAEDCIGEYPRSMSGVASGKTLENIEERRAGRLAQSDTVPCHRGLEPF